MSPTSPVGPASRSRGPAPLAATLHRQPSTDAGTFGTLSLLGRSWPTGELPARDNRRGESCIPAGVYRAVYHRSPRFGACYWLQDVPGRSEVLIHRGNWCGDIAKGLRSDVRGCILLGTARGVLKGQPALTGSAAAVDAFLDLADGRPLLLTVTDSREARP